MKKLFFFTVLSLALFSCTGNKKQTETSNEVKTTAATDSVAPGAQSFELDKLLAVADQNVDKTVTVVGYVTHTCKHSGKRCFIVGESHKASLRVEAKGDIGGFNRELVGSKLSITGVLKEYRLTQDYINKMEKEVQVKKEDDESAESCDTELNSISSMRKWMKDNNKDYYVIYYIDGMKYDTLD